MDSFDRFNETELPSKDKFYSVLNDSHIAEEQYEHAINVWKTSKIKNLGEYSKSDVLLLANVSENFSMQY